jgi:hypothetical protein
MKKRYAKGYKYYFNRKSLINPSMLVLENKLLFGQGRLEAKIFLERGLYQLLITDGYTYVTYVNGMKQSLKGVLNIAHGKMQAITKSNKAV